MAVFGMRWDDLTLMRELKTSLASEPPCLTEGTIRGESMWVKFVCFFLIISLLTSLADKCKAKSTLSTCFAADIFSCLRGGSNRSWNSFTAVGHALCLRENADLAIFFCPTTHSTRRLLAWSDGTIGPRNRILHGNFLTDLVYNILVYGLLIDEFFQPWLFGDLLQGFKSRSLSTGPCWKGLQALACTHLWPLRELPTCCLTFSFY